jgi:alpha-1,3-rhamnosyl/mannosyltransferase
MTLSGERIAITCTALRAPLTGVGHYTFNLIRELQSLLDAPPWLFYGGEWTRELREVAPPSDVNVRNAIASRIPDAYRVARWLQQRRFSAGVRERGIALYHEPNYLAYRFAGPSVVTVHDLSWIRHPETHPPERVRMMNDILPRALAQASQVMVDSDFVRDEVMGHYGLEASRVTTVHAGVSGEFRPVPPAERDAVLRARGLESGRYLLTVGTFEPRKNLRTIIEAFERLPEALRRRYPLVLAGAPGWGDTEIAQRVEALVRSGDVRLAGYVPREELPALYSGAAVFVYASLYEGFGLPPLEAMACGAPVIASSASSLPEVVGEAGVLVDPLDAMALAESMQALLEDAPRREALAAAGVARAAGFTWRRCAEKALGVYRRALSGPGATPA